MINDAARAMERPVRLMAAKILLCLINLRADLR
jgi:hypothetical protein